MMIDNQLDAGQSYVIFGTSDARLSQFQLTTLDGLNGFKIQGRTSGDESGYGINGAGDINGDGLNDLLLGTHWAPLSDQGNIGEVYFVFGCNYNAHLCIK